MDLRMKTVLAIIMLSITAVLAYWLFSDSNNETPELVFTSNFSMTDIKLPDFDVPVKIITPTAEIQTQTDIIITATLLTDTEIVVINEVSETIEIEPKKELEQPLNLNDKFEKLQYFDDLRYGQLQQMSLKNSHPFFENINDKAYKIIPKEVFTYLSDGIDEGYATEIKAIVKNHYQHSLNNIKAICGNQWCNALGTLPPQLKIDKSLCKTLDLSSSNCKENITLRKTDEYVQAKYQHDLDCSEKLTTPIPEYDNKGKKVSAAKFTRKLNKKIKKCQRNTSDIDEQFERQVIIKIQRLDSKNINLQPLSIEEIPLINTGSDNLERELKQYIQHELSMLKMVLPESLNVNCADTNCGVGFTAHLKKNDNTINIDPYFDFQHSHHFCSFVTDIWDDGGDFE
jgi:hypothetical protein